MLRLIGRDDPLREAAIERLCRRETTTALEVMETARAIIADVRARGDVALRELTLRHDRRELGAIELDRDQWRRQASETPATVQVALARAHERIRRFHDEEARRLRQCGFTLDDGEAHLSLRLSPLARAGLYVPGGTASYPSSVLMAAVPARAAGVEEVLMVTPGPSPAVLHAAAIAGVDRVFLVGGAQAIAALAYGTASVPRVDKIVGPGNAYVAAAKRLVFGDVAIDQVAGPSEILIVADPDADATWIAADLLSQAEHDVDAHAVLVTWSVALAGRVDAEVQRQLADLPRRAIAEASIREHAATVIVDSLDEALAFTARFAPEHVELMVADAARVATRVCNAGAIFVGAHTPEAAGDYYAGPNHVLPTGGAARYGSPLGVHDFFKRTSVIEYDAATLAAHAADIICLAESEGLSAHARAVAARTVRGSGT